MHRPKSVGIFAIGRIIIDAILGVLTEQHGAAKLNIVKGEII